MNSITLTEKQISIINRSLENEANKTLELMKQMKSLGLPTENLIRYYNELLESCI